MNNMDIKHCEIIRLNKIKNLKSVNAKQTKAGVAKNAEKDSTENT